MNTKDINKKEKNIDYSLLNNNEKNINYLYLIRLREFVKTNEYIYKIGRTKQIEMKRINQYPKGSELIIFRKCINCIKIEIELIKQFKIKYKHCQKYGNEYFEGNELDMINDINKIIDIEHEINFSNINNKYYKVCIISNNNLGKKCYYNENKINIKKDIEYIINDENIINYKTKVYM